MMELFASILPLALASALSPIILAVSIALLAKGNTKAAAALVSGGLLAALAIAVAGASVAEEDDKAAEALGFKPGAADLFFGLIFLAFGAKIFLEKPGSGLKAGAGKNRGALGWLAISFAGNITNFDAVLLNFAAVRQIFNSTAAPLYKMSLLAFCDFFFVAPALVPLLVYYAAPKKCEKLLAPVGAWMGKYGHYLVGLIFMLFSLYLMKKWL